MRKTSDSLVSNPGAVWDPLTGGRTWRYSRASAGSGSVGIPTMDKAEKLVNRINNAYRRSVSHPTNLIDDEIYLIDSERQDLLKELMEKPWWEMTAEDVRRWEYRLDYLSLEALV